MLVCLYECFSWKKAGLNDTTNVRQRQEMRLRDDSLTNEALSGFESPA